MKKKITAVLLAALTALTMAACGSEDTEDAADTTAKTTAAEKADKDDTTTETTTEAATTTEATTTEETTTEHEPEALKGDTAYWDFICSEYDKPSNPKQFFTINDTVYGYYDGNVNIYAGRCDGANYRIDKNTNELSFYQIDENTDPLTFNGGGSVWLLNDSIYTIVSNTTYVGDTEITRTDLNGELLGEIKVEGQFINFFEDGSILLKNDPEDGIYGYTALVVSPDFSDIKSYYIEVDAGHKRTKTVEYFKDVRTYVGKDTFYVEYSDSLNKTFYGEVCYSINKDTGDYSLISEDDPLHYSYQVRDGACYQVGNYIILNIGIFNIETSEKVCDCNLGEMSMQSMPYTYNRFNTSSRYMFCVYREYKEGTENYVIYKYIAPASYYGKSEDILENRYKYIRENGIPVYESGELEISKWYCLGDDYLYIRDKTGEYLECLETGEEKIISINS